MLRCFFYMCGVNPVPGFNFTLQGSAKEEAKADLWSFSDEFNGQFFKVLKDKEADKAYAKENLGI